MEDRKIVSDREQKEWYTRCPLRITGNTITKGNDGTFLRIAMLPCTDTVIAKIEVRAAFADARRAPLDTLSYTVRPEDSGELPCPENAVYVVTTVENVYGADDGLLWSRGNSKPAVLPAQEILWQTDPLYEQLRRECEGIVKPVYRPDTIDGGWRCTCGHINLTESGRCGACGADHEWLITHFDPEFLKRQQAVYEDLKAASPEKKKVVYRNEKMREDQRKMYLLLGGIGAVIILVVLLFVLVIPSVRYSNAVKALEAGEFAKAAAVFADLGGFRDAEERVGEAVYRKAQAMTGLDSVNPVTTAECPWFAITEDGVLSMRKEKYTGSWEHFVIPDMVDGVIVRELSKSFFLNCDEMIEVTLSDCLEVLGEQTFFNCASLRKVHFGKSITAIGARAFINCTSLTEIVIPDTVTEIGLRAFNSCTNLRNVSLGSGITKLPSYVFSCCSSLEQVFLRGIVTEIGAYAFSECPAVKTITYSGTAEQWNDVVIAPEDNDILSEVTVITAE